MQSPAAVSPKCIPIGLLLGLLLSLPIFFMIFIDVSVPQTPQHLADTHAHALHHPAGSAKISPQPSGHP